MNIAATSSIGNITALDVAEFLIVVVAALFAITMHELAHGYTAYLLGDTTAKDQGRLTLNPIKHIDPFGLLALVILKIGWAKPVPINPMKFKKRKSGTILVSLAGPAMNLLLAFLFGLLYKITLGLNDFVTYLFLYSMIVNVGLGVFNLLPLPPLDGSKILASLLPQKWEMYFYKYERYLSLLVLILYFTGVVSAVILPVINSIINFIVYVV